MMKRQLIVSMAALAVFLLMAGTALAKDILVINGTSFEIHAIALSDSASEKWGEDLLGDEKLAPGEGLKINLSGESSGWDMAVVDEAGQQLEFKNLDFTDYSKVTLYSDGTASFE